MRLLQLLDHHHARRDGPVHRLPAGLKLGVALAVLVTAVFLPPRAIAGYAGLGVLLGLAISWSGVPLLFLVQRLLVLSPFVLGVALVHLVHPEGRADWVATVFKSFLCLLTVVLVSNTTPFSDVLRVLRRVRVPGLLVTTLALMHRYLFVLADEAGRMSRAGGKPRSFTGRRRTQWHALSTVIGQLFVRASERAERIYAAMCARGWR